MKRRYSPMQWQFWVSRTNPETNVFYTRNEAIKHISSFRKWSVFYWLKRINPLTNKPYTIEEAKIQVSLIQRKMSNKSNNKHKHRKDRVPTQIQYWIKQGYSNKIAKQKVSKRQQTFSLDICIKKYGKEQGLIIWKNRQIKWQKTLNKKSNKEIKKINEQNSPSILKCIKKFGINLGIDKYCNFRIEQCKSDKHIINKTKEFILKTKKYKDFNKVYDKFRYNANRRHGQASKESLKYLIPIYKFCRKKGLNRSDLRIGISGSKEYKIINKKTSNSFDFCCISKKFIIEYNNKFWHPDPYIMEKNEWNKWKHPIKKWNAIEKYTKDQNKNRLAIKNEFKIFTIWDCKDYNKQIKKAKEFILNEIKNNN